MKKNLVGFLVAAVLVTLTLPAIGAPIRIGEGLPDITVLSLDGKEVSLTSYFGSEEKAGKATLLVFFNTSCSLCQEELEDLKKLSGKDKIQVVAVGIDMLGPKVLNRFLKNRGYTFTVLSDSKFKGGSTLGFGFTPASAYFDKHGKLVKKFFGYRDVQKKEIHDLF